MNFDSSTLIEPSGKDYAEKLKQELLSKVSNVEMLKTYLPGDGVKYQRICSFHKENTPSMCVDLTKGIVKCFGCGFAADGIGYIQHKYNLTFVEAIKVIMNDFGLLTYDKQRVPLEIVGISHEKLKELPTKIMIKSRSWTQADLDFWIKFNISKDIAIQYKVYPISHYWINQHVFSIPAGELAYAFLEGDKFQIYRPFAPKDKKWFSNTGSMIYGYDQLPEYGDLLIVTSSKKDIMSLRSLGYWAVSGSNEGSELPVEKYEDLNNRFKQILLFFNNDPQGLKAAHQMSLDLGVGFMFIPFHILSKDPSDYIRDYGSHEAQELINKLLNEFNQ